MRGRARERGGENVKQSIQRDGWENVYFGYMCGYKFLCWWKLNKSILKGLNGIAHAHMCVCVCVCVSF